MADLRNNFVGIKSPNPFWLASAPPTDKAYNVERAFKAGWGGVVWKTLGEEGPPVVNVNGPRYGAIWGADRRLLGLQQYRADHRPRRCRSTCRKSSRSRRTGRTGRWSSRIMVPCEEESWKAILPLVEETERRRHRAQFRLPARHERARHGRRRRPGARICRDGRALVQAVHAHAGDHQAHAQHHRHPPARPRAPRRAAPTR